MFSLPLHIFPANGLDRSLHAPIVLGLIIVSFFTEALGWTYAGLVVPGYLAATFVAAPVTAYLVLGEAILTHAAVLLVASIIPRHTGAWSTAFGRERFFLYIVVAIIVRLGIEGSLVPWATARYPLAHSRELYSIGLVLVPLVANVFWSAGMLHSGPRLLVLTGATYFLVTRALLEYTNYSLSRFEVANESVALHFLETSKAYLLLLSGALIGARGNVRYGWDYNGILVPALLAVAWYQPLHVLGTALEAVGIYLLARFLASVPPWSRVALVGSRRMLFVGVLGLLVKLAVGHALARWAPAVQITEYLGFGYILPSLLAVKMWNKSAIGVVLMPTLQVSLTAFLVGNGLGFGLNWATGVPLAPAATSEPMARVESAAFELLLASTEPVPRPGECVAGPEGARFEALVRESLEAGALSPAEVGRVSAGTLQASLDEQGWFVIAARPGAERLCQSYATALSPAHARAGGSLLIRVAPELNGGSALVTALALADATRAPIVVSARRAGGALGLDRRAEPLPLSSHPTLQLGIASSGGPRLRVRGSLPRGLDVAALERRLGERIELDWVSGAQGFAELSLSAASSDAIAASLLGAPELETWPGSVRRELGDRAERLLSLSFRTPRIEELRLLSSSVLPALESAASPSAWVRCAADRLGYRIAGAGAGADQSWVLHEFGRSERRGLAIWVVRRRPAEAVAIEVPAPLWELGTLSLGLGLFDAQNARYLLLGGARPDASADSSADPRRAAGKSGSFQRLHEYMLGARAFAIAIHGAAEATALATDVVIETDHPVLSVAQAPAWLAPASQTLAQIGLRTAWYGAALEHVQLGAQFDPAFAFAARFAPGRMARLWFSQAARVRAPRLPPADWALGQLALGSVPELDVSARAFDGLACAGADCPAPRAAGCDLNDVVARLERWLAGHNPFERVAAVASARGCHLEIAVDQRTGVPWAIVSETGAARLVPLHAAQSTRQGSAPIATRDAARRAVELGMATVLVEPP